MQSRCHNATLLISVYFGKDVLKHQSQKNAEKP